MAIARFRSKQWTRVVPLQFVSELKGWWGFVAPYILHEATITKAIETACEVSEAERLFISHKEQHLGFCRIWVFGKKPGQKWCLDLWHCVHFRGCYSKVPDWQTATYIRFSLIEPPPGSNPEKKESHLKIVEVG